MIEDDRANSLLRAVAAAPPTRPPAMKVTAIVIEPGEADAMVRVRELVKPFAVELTARSDGGLVATVASHRANAAASCALALQRALPRARIAIATEDMEGPGACALDGIAERTAVRLPRAGAVAIDQSTADVLDARFEVRAEGDRMFLDERRAPRTDAQANAASDNGEARIARAMGDEFLFNTGRLVVLNLVAVGLGLLDSVVRGRTHPSMHEATPLWLLWFLISSTRVAAVRFRPSLRRWALYSIFVVDLPLAFAIQYRIFALSTNPPEVAAFTLSMFAVVPAVTQFLLPPRFIVALATVLTVAVSALFVLAGKWSSTGVCATTLGILAAAAIYGQSRSKALLRRIIAESDARVRDAEAANVELRRQVAERSRDLSEALARLAGVPQSARLGPGDVVEDRYRIVRRIGAGGMGEVYEVERITDGRRLALKTMTGAVHREALARFAREAQIAAELDAPNLVAAVDVGVTPTGTLFLVMELVAGSSLAALRDRYGDARWAIPILAQVARALAAMHGRGIVHRDLKPSNILLGGAIAKVADFGIAGLVDGDPLADTIAAADAVASPALTRTGAIVGTPLYMAPELARGARGAGAAADMFSFGVVAYELLAARLPHATPPVLDKLADRAVPAPVPLANVKPTLSAELCALVDRCLGEAPDTRPTAELVAATLARGV